VFNFGRSEMGFLILEGEGGGTGTSAFARCRWRLPVLERFRPSGHNASMSTKQIVEDLLQKLPENVTLHDVAREIEFVAAVRQGLGELDRAEGIPLDEVEREMPSWVIK